MSFLDGNSATYLAALTTLAVLCFFGTNIEKEDKQENLFNHKDESGGSNFVQKLLSIITKRALAFLKREERNSIKVLEVDNYEILSNAIAKSEDKINPYKQKMLELADNLQFLTLNYQTEIFILRQDIEKLYRKMTYYDLTEFLSSSFYSFLFCISILTLDCLNGTEQWCVDIASLVSIISFIYWIFIWIYYWISIKNREELDKNNGIAYEFSLKKCIFHFVILLFSIEGICLYLNSSISFETILFLIIIIIYAIVLIFKFIHKNRSYSIFTHYFNLVHWGFIFFFVGVFCFIQYLFIESTTESIFSPATARTLSILFALFSCLIFPLVIPILRFKREINKSIKKFTVLRQKYTHDNQENKKELEKYFDDLCKLRTLIPVDSIH